MCRALARNFITRGIMTLTNNTKGMLVYTLPHAEACKDGPCSCSTQEHGQTAHDPKTGAKGVRMVAMNVPSSLYIAAGETVSVSDSVLFVSKIQKDIKAKILVRKGS